jgi:hypothetical protein
MCPACIATAAVIAVKATSTGGLTASIVTKYGSKNVANKVCTQTKSRGEGRAIPKALLRTQERPYKPARQVRHFSSDCQSRKNLNTKSHTYAREQL